jgi:signal peptidase II
MFAYGIIIALAVFILDQASKYWLMFGVQLLERAPVEVTPFMNLVVVWNRGISFGMFSRHEADLRYVLIAFACMLTAFLLHWLSKADSRFMARALGLVIGGAIGNVADRLQYGAVFDFLDLHLVGYHYPAFNVADSAIVIGVLCMVWDGLWHKKKVS